MPHGSVAASPGLPEQEKDVFCKLLAGSQALDGLCHTFDTKLYAPQHRQAETWHLFLTCIATTHEAHQ